jgi:hypothetical protein
MQKKRTIKLNIKLPKGVYATPEMEAKVIDAALGAIKSFASGIEAARTAAAELQKKGFAITAEELLARRAGRKVQSALSTKAKSVANKAPKARKRVVLSAKQKDEIADALKNGKATANALAKKYGCSPATINLLKKERGLTKSRKK